MGRGERKIGAIRANRIRYDITVMSLLEKLSVSQAVTKLFACYRTRSFIIAL